MILIPKIKKMLIYNKRNNPDPNESDSREISIMVLIPWASYLLAQGLNMSGIVSIMFCGISMARYAVPNLTISDTKVLFLKKKLYKL